MASLGQIRGALLEEAVLHLLGKVGYDVYDPHAMPATAHMRMGKSGLEVRGRGSWHQIDAFATWRHSPAFMYPLNLMVEAKCYAKRNPIGIEVPRNCVGVLKDISENYFSTVTRSGATLQSARYNYTAAIFSTSGYTKGAVEYAVAHQVFLIQYENIPTIQPLIDAIYEFGDDCISPRHSAASKDTIGKVRRYYRERLAGALLGNDDTADVLTDRGKALLRGPATLYCRRIQGSYFGMLNGRWPLHLLRRQPLPASAFKNDTLPCRVLQGTKGQWKFVPTAVEKNSARWFELEFSLPSVIAELVQESQFDEERMAALQKRYFSFIDLSGIIGGIRRNIRLMMEPGWVDRYVERERQR
ncbi:hypothetical protein IMZ29_03875 [Achromobacter sp. GG226]|uniref:hypothetical protein n=1 Tax=Verticiella alkaliphila TaxID=2779529 RepID=UPI001C0C1E9D|nr:hypothetical protein [Verticiella sp. GG226]MBU4609717.1 hypothetical protein [Verticiella sp. GG226]